MDGDRRDEVEEEQNLGPFIPVLDETEHLTELMDWGIHEVAASYRRHVAPNAQKQTCARLRYWHPPLYWDGEWMPPLKWKQERPPHYNCVLAQWKPPLEWPPVQITTGQLVIWLRHPDINGGDKEPTRPAGRQLSQQMEEQGGGESEDRGPSQLHLKMAEEAYDAYSMYDASRMRAYSHFNMPHPVVRILPGMVLRSERVDYVVRLIAPRCERCGERHTKMKHKRYIELYTMVPFMCRHGMPIDDLIIDDEADRPLIEIPTTLDRLMPDGVSESTASSMCAAKASRDLSKMLGKGRVAVEMFKKLLSSMRLTNYDYTYLPQVKPEQLTRMIALLEKGMEEAKLDLEMEG